MSWLLYRCCFLQVFTSMALFNILIVPLNAFPWVLNGLMEAWVSIHRVDEFMQLTEQDWKHYYTDNLGAVLDSLSSTTGLGCRMPIYVYVCHVQDI